jgi:hypothetical protein
MRGQLYGFHGLSFASGASGTDFATDLSAAVDVYGEWVDAAGQFTVLLEQLYR